MQSLWNHFSIQVIFMRKKNKNIDANNVDKIQKLKLDNIK